jgi:hypothetical protein
MILSTPLELLDVMFLENMFWSEKNEVWTVDEHYTIQNGLIN